MRKFYLSILIFILTFFAVFSAQAEHAAKKHCPSHTGFYIDANIGYVFSEESLFDSSTQDGIGFNTNFGYQFNRYVAAEIGYIYLNNLEGNGIHWGILDLKGILPLNNVFNFFAKAGLAVVLNKSTSAALFLAAGGEYFFTPHFDMHVQLSGEVTGFANFGLISAGFSYHF